MRQGSAGETRVTEWIKSRGSRWMRCNQDAVANEDAAWSVHRGDAGCAEAEESEDDGGGEEKKAGVGSRVGLENERHDCDEEGSDRGAERGQASLVETTCAVARGVRIVEVGERRYPRMCARAG